MRLVTEVHPGGTGSEMLTAALFTRLWVALADLLGTAATATLLHRAACLASPRAPELRELAFARLDGHFTYSVPASFHRSKGPSVALRELVGELQPLLAEATGPVARRHLARVPELQGWADLAA